MSKMKIATTCLATMLGGCGDDSQPSHGTMPDAGVDSKTDAGSGDGGNGDGDFPDGTLLRLTPTVERSVGLIPDCGIEPTWTWHYWSQAVLVPAGDNARVPKLSLVYDPVRHSFFGQGTTTIPQQGFEADEALLFDGGTFAYTHIWWDNKGKTCQSDWDGNIEVVE